MKEVRLFTNPGLATGSRRVHPQVLKSIYVVKMCNKLTRREKVTWSTGFDRSVIGKSLGIYSAFLFLINSLIVHLLMPHWRLLGCDACRNTPSRS